MKMDSDVWSVIVLAEVMRSGATHAWIAKGFYGTRVFYICTGEQQARLFAHEFPVPVTHYPSAMSIGQA